MKLAAALVTVIALSAVDRAGAGSPRTRSQSVVSGVGREDLRVPTRTASPTASVRISAAATY